MAPKRAWGDGGGQATSDEATFREGGIGEREGRDLKEGKPNIGKKKMGFFFASKGWKEEEKSKCAEKWFHVFRLTIPKNYDSVVGEGLFKVPFLLLLVRAAISILCQLFREKKKKKKALSLLPPSHYFLAELMCFDKEGFTFWQQKSLQESKKKKKEDFSSASLQWWKVT